MRYNSKHQIPAWISVSNVSRMRRKLRHLRRKSRLRYDPGTLLYDQTKIHMTRRGGFMTAFCENSPFFQFSSPKASSTRITDHQPNHHLHQAIHDLRLLYHMCNIYSYMLHWTGEVLVRNEANVERGAALWHAGAVGPDLCDIEQQRA